MAGQKGESNPRAKLTELDVVQIRAMRNAGEKIETIHAMFPHVSQNVIVRTIRRETWAHVPWWREWADVYGEPTTDAKLR